MLRPLLMSFCVVTLPFGFAQAQTQEKPSGPPSSKAGDEAEKKQIEKPTPTMDGFLGDYYFGDGLGVNCTLNVAEGGTFTFRWTGCKGENDRNNGTWSFKDGLLVLAPEQPNVRENFKGTATRLFPVILGRRHYLIAEEGIIDFCHSYKKHSLMKGLNKMSPFFYLRRGDEKLPIKGEPSVPELYRRYLTEPFVARVVEINSDDSFRIDRGRKDGVVVGMMFNVENGDNFAYEVKEVADDAAVCVARDLKADKSLVKVGAKVEPFMAD